MNSLLLLLKAKPNTEARELRPILSEYLPSDIPIDATYLRNFRLRVAYFHAANPNYRDVTLQQTQGLLSRRDLTEEEHSVYDNPIARVNFIN